MAAINILSKQVSELIAAGEVIERPASVIKELVENAIDAHSTAITVEIKNGGVTFMRVADNGTGIERDDVRNAFLRHATSKIANQDDLDSIATLGFRGEALASICAVSRVELITKSIKEDDGTLYKLDGGEEKEFMTIGCPQGTTFIVRDLFYNVPARMKFLKKDSAESNNISSLIDRIALSHPEISFTFIRDGKQILKTSGNGNLDTTIFQIFGKQFFSTLIPVSYEYQGIKLSGFVSNPINANRASRNMQIFFVNGRYVRTKTAMAALEQAYKGFIMVGKFPAGIIKLEMNCSTLDVNVHPAKLEIRFTNERPVYECVYHAVRTAISEFDVRNNNSPQPDFIPTNPKVLGRTADRGTQLGFSYSSQASKNDEPEIYMPLSSWSDTVTLHDSGSVVSAYYNSGNINIKKINLAEHLKDKKDKNTTSNNILSFPLNNKEHIHQERTLYNDITKSTKTENDFIQPELSTQTSSPEDIKPNMSSSDDISQDSSFKESTNEKYSDEHNSLPVQSIEQEESGQILVNAVIVDDDHRELPKKYIGEAFSAYLIIEYGNDKLMFIDKHAAHERLIYERLKRQHKNSDPQLLLDPVTITLDKADHQAVLENRELLMDAGFEVEDFGSGTILLRAVPIFLEKLEITEAFLEIAQYLRTHKKLIISEKMEWIYQNTACRAAIKAGNKNKPEELIELALELERNPDVKYCPHGRPIYFLLSKNEIEKNFKRI